MENKPSGIHVSNTKLIFEQIGMKGATVVAATCQDVLECLTKSFLKPAGSKVKISFFTKKSLRRKCHPVLIKLLLLLLLLLQHPHWSLSAVIIYHLTAASSWSSSLAVCFHHDQTGHWLVIQYSYGLKTHTSELFKMTVQNVTLKVPAIQLHS